MDDKVVPLVDYSTGVRRVVGSARVWIEEGEMQFDATVDPEISTSWEAILGGDYSVNFVADDVDLSAFRVNEMIPIRPFKLPE